MFWIFRQDSPSYISGNYLLSSCFFTTLAWPFSAFIIQGENKMITLKSQDLFLGIDIGGTNTILGLVDSRGKIIFRKNFSTNSFATPQEMVLALKDSVFHFIQGSENYSKPLMAGIGAPNVNYYKGTIEYPANLKWQGLIPFKRIFEEISDLPCVLTNDAKAGALGEMYFGGAHGMKDFIFITLGTGLGSGIVVNGDLVYGHDGFAGEIGHTIVVPHGRPCGCGRKGCLEQYCSATGLVTTYREIMLSAGFGWSETIDRLSLDAKSIYHKAQQGDEAAFYAFNYTGEILGIALANSVAYTSPEAIFLSGGLADSGDFLFDPAKLAFEKNLLNVFKEKIKILPSALSAGDATVIGAASLARNLYEKLL